MKKMMKRFAVLTAVILLLGAMAIPALAEGYDFGPAIEEFEPTPLNTISLEVGQTDKPGASLWMDNGMATAYSSDEAVATVAEDGTVTAVGEGTAYVVFCVNTLEKMYRYDVTAIKEEAPVQTPAQPEDKEVLRNQAGIGAIVLAVLLLAGRIVGLVIVCKKAPEADMSKAWALLSLISAAFAVVLIIIMSKNSKQKPGKGKVVCPVCNTIHSENTTRCNICGAIFR